MREAFRREVGGGGGPNLLWLRWLMSPLGLGPWGPATSQPVSQRASELRAKGGGIFPPVSLFALVRDRFIDDG